MGFTLHDLGQQFILTSTICESTSRLCSMNQYQRITSRYLFPLFLLSSMVYFLSFIIILQCLCLFARIYHCCLDKGGHPFLFGPPSSRYASTVVLASYLLYTYFGPPSSSLLLKCRATSWGCPYSQVCPRMITSQPRLVTDKVAHSVWSPNVQIRSIIVRYVEVKKRSSYYVRSYF